MIEVTSKGDYSKTRNFLNSLVKGNLYTDLDSYGRMGVEALSIATPIDTGLASKSWEYKIIRHKNYARIDWYNTDIEGGVPVVILVQYGHATRGGTWVPGRDFINPAMRPVFERIANEIWEKVKSS